MNQGRTMTVAFLENMEEYVRVIARSCHTTLVPSSVYGGSFFLASTVLHFLTSQLIGAD
jgi:hypothetical protein